MKKIMFSDKFGLTEAVLCGRKTQTRRIVSESLWNKWTEYDDFCGSVGVRGLNEIGVAVTREYSDCEKFFLDNSPFKIGEVVAVAQSYKDCNDGIIEAPNLKGFTDKRCVVAELMPHQIRITDVRVERLQDISDEDCIAEGIYKDDGKTHFNGYAFQITRDQYGNMLSKQWYSTPREAYAALIDRISGKGTFERNPYVFVYEFELIK